MSEYCRQTAVLAFIWCPRHALFYPKLHSIFSYGNRIETGSLTWKPRFSQKPEKPMLVEEIPWAQGGAEGQSSPIAAALLQPRPHPPPRELRQRADAGLALARTLVVWQPNAADLPVGRINLLCGSCPLLFQQHLGRWPFPSGPAAHRGLDSLTLCRHTCAAGAAAIVPATQWALRKLRAPSRGGGGLPFMFLPKQRGACACVVLVRVFSGVAPCQHENAVKLPVIIIGKIAGILLLSADTRHRHSVSGTAHWFLNTCFRVSLASRTEASAVQVFLQPIQSLGDKVRE